jgi:hypothetical protein
VKKIRRMKRITKNQEEEKIIKSNGNIWSGI